ncbi:MAG TPA: hypothetical protein VGX68_25825 [Thermoanaerobaculia bacterium]|jgi:hypothetical protein|nr:hypothetical protein [Thermoanaerobaculia bacterium]
MATADDKSRFEILFGALRDHQQGLLENTAKTAGFLLLSIGWLATSQTARETLNADGLLRGAAIGGVLVATALYIAAAFHVYRAAQRIRARLIELAYLPLEDIETRGISALLLAVLTLGNLTISLLLVVLIWRLGR